jgi:GWxTD domain-containing protein
MTVLSDDGGENQDMTRNAIVTMILLSGLIGIASAQENRLSVQAGISIFADPAVGPESFVEFPFSLERSQFSFIRYDSASEDVRASIFAEIIIMDTLGNHLDSASTYFYTAAHSPMESRLGNIKVFNKLSMKLKPAVYSAILTVMDVVNKREGTFAYDRLEIPPVERDRLSLSMIELAYNIRSIDELPAPNSRLVKSGREVIPNPMGIYGADDSALYVYAEVYNLNYNEDSPGKYAVSYKASDPQGFLKFDFGRSEREMTGSSAVISARLEIPDWEPGKYDLALIVEDLTNGMVDTTKRRFIIFPQHDLPTEFVQYSMRSPLDSASLTTKSQLIKYLATPEQMTLYSSLNDTGKSRFIEEFFRDHDPTPGTKENEYLNDALARYAYAMQNFGTLPEARDGWRSDRGRILMQYGQWDKREDVPTPVYGQRYEIWYYYGQQGGIYFIFSDVKGYGEFKLVHSNATGEIYDNEWEYRLKNQGQELYQGGSQFIE